MKRVFENIWKKCVEIAEGDINRAINLAKEAIIYHIGSQERVPLLAERKDDGNTWVITIPDKHILIDREGILVLDRS